MSDLKKQFKDFMANFEKGQLIGVDIGLSAVKVALLSNTKKNKFRLDHYAAIPLAEAAIIEDEIQKPEEIIDALAQALEDARIKPRICNLGMDGPNTMTKRLQVPDGAKDEVEDNILWESEQYIPFGADESEVDFSILGKIEEDDVVDVVVAAAKISVVENYIEYLSEAGLVVKKVDLNVFAVNNMFELVVGDKLEEVSEVGSIIIDFGAQTTTVLVYKDGGPVLSKEIPVGGVLITEEIQRQMGVSYEEAEDLKTNGDSNGNLPEEIVSIIQSQLQNQMAELRKVLNFFIAAGSSEQVGFCYVTGGSCRLPGLMESLHDVIGIEPQLLNPFDVIGYDPKSFDQDSL
ncbi:MAG: type IV pilus assembly protein PilM, partial [Bacteriovoracaceae bacterium]|nr:type IV pilus assembly protein PilM [Bacteriovoracaceae bacterium]